MIRFFRPIPLVLLTSLSIGLLSCDAIETGTLSDDDIFDTIDIGATMTEVFGSTASDLADEPDPAVQSAGEAATAAEREKEKESDPLDPGKILDVLENVPLGRDPQADPNDDPLDPGKILDALESAPLGNDPPSSGGSSSGGSTDDAYDPSLAPQSPADARALVEEDPRNYFRRMNQAVAEVAAGETPEGAKAAALYLIDQFGPDTIDPHKEYLFWYASQLETAIKGSVNGSPEYQRLLAEYCAQIQLWEANYPGEYSYRRASLC